MPSNPFWPSHIFRPLLYTAQCTAQQQRKEIFFALDILNEFFNHFSKAMISPCWAWHKKVQGKVLLWSIFCGVTLLPLPPHAISPHLKRHTGAPDRSEKTHPVLRQQCAMCQIFYTLVTHTHIFCLVTGLALPTEANMPHTFNTLVPNNLWGNTPYINWG